MQTIHMIVSTRCGPGPFRSRHETAFPGHPEELRALRTEQAHKTGSTAATHAFRAGYSPLLLDAPSDYDRRRAPFLGRAL